MGVAGETRAVSIFGVRVNLLTQDELLEAVVHLARSEGKKIIANVNVHALNTAYREDRYRAFLQSSDLVFCDGFGVLLGSRLLGHRVRSTYRTTCPDWIDVLCHRCAAEGLAVFFLGGAPGVADKAIDRLLECAQGLRVQSHHGFFELAGEQNEKVIQEINHFKPDILYVGMGMPLQEYWIADNIQRVEAKLFMPLGACLDFYTQTVWRAPRWMTDRGLEWLGRLAAEPRRLWRRYLIGNPVFLWRVFLQRVGVTKFSWFRVRPPWTHRRDP